MLGCMPPHKSSSVIVKTNNANKKKEAKTITIKAVGDLVFPKNFSAKKNLLSTIEPYLDADLLLGNLEGPITKHNICAKDLSKKYMFAFKYKPKQAMNTLTQSGFDILHIANNHSYDYGGKGFWDTQKNLTQSKIDFVGTKSKIVYRKHNGITVAFVGFDYAYYFNSLFNVAAIKKQLKEAKNKADIVFVSVHGGAEGPLALHIPDKREIFLGSKRGNIVRFAHLAIDSGADAVVGFGPHVLRAMEIYKGKLIAYSIGNFLPKGGLSTKNEMGYSIILELKFNGLGKLLKSKIIPVVFDKNKLPTYDLQNKSIDLIKKLNKHYYKKHSLDHDHHGVDIDQNGEIYLTK